MHSLSSAYPKTDNGCYEEGAVKAKLEVSFWAGFISLGWRSLKTSVNTSIAGKLIKLDYRGRGLLRRNF